MLYITFDRHTNCKVVSIVYRLPLDALLVLGQHAHLLNGLIAEDNGKAVDAGGSHARRQPLREYIPTLVRIQVSKMAR